MPKSLRISEQLRSVILSADISRYRIAKDVGITEAALSRFVNEHSGLSQESIDSICERLGLTLGTSTPKGTSIMGKKKTAGQKAAETKAKQPATFADVDRLLARALTRLEGPAPDLSMAKRAITNARKTLRKACLLPTLK
jgi:transcriptional regulator with XRE-family HTH domain